MFPVDACDRSTPHPSVYQFDPAPLTQSMRLVRTPNGFAEKGKPIARSGRKVTGLSETAGLPKHEFAQQAVQLSLAVRHTRPQLQESPMHQAKILVADDSRTIRALVRRALTDAGYDVTLASDGLEAVQFARRDHPDLVILDIQMPQMDGYTACEQILELGEASDELPIIFLTKDSAKHLSALGNELGAYLPKPVQEETLISTVRTLLQQRTASPTC